MSSRCATGSSRRRTRRWEWSSVTTSADCARRRSREAAVHPRRDVVEEVLRRVAVLAGRFLAGRARRDAVGRTFDDDEVLVAAGGLLEMNLAVADEVVSAH